MVSVIVVIFANGLFKTLLLRWLLLKMPSSDPSYFANFEHVKNFSSYFAEFEQVKIFSSYFADFEQ